MSTITILLYIVPRRYASAAMGCRMASAQLLGCTYNIRDSGDALFFIPKLLYSACLKVSVMAQEIICPHCSRSIVLDEALTSTLREKMRREFDERLLESERKHSLELERARQESAARDEQLRQMQQATGQKIADALKLQKVQMEAEASQKASESMQVVLRDMQAQLLEKDERLKRSQEEELRLRKAQRELEDAKKDLELEMARRLDEERKRIFEDATKRMALEHELKDKERQKQIDDMTRQITELKRKAEQGSQKLQGEVLELELERMLKDNFAYDDISPVSSGIRGADVIQRVRQSSGRVCGTILLESKQAKNWSAGWIDKLKDDLRAAKADVGVIVSTVLPEGVSNFSCIDGIMVVGYGSALPVIGLVRSQLIEIANAKSFNVSRNEKMEALYRYLIGPDFKHRVEGAVDSLAHMLEDLDKEKRAFAKMWAKREKDIESAFCSIAGIYGSMQGMIGSSLPEIKSLDMLELAHDAPEAADQRTIGGFDGND